MPKWWKFQFWDKHRKTALAISFTGFIASYMVRELSQLSEMTEMPVQSALLYYAGTVLMAANMMIIFAVAAREVYDPTHHSGR